MVAPILAFTVCNRRYFGGAIGIIVVLAIALWWLTPKRLQLHVTSDPVGARLEYDGSFIGTTPCDISVPLRSDVGTVLISAVWPQMTGVGRVHWAAGIPSGFRAFMFDCNSEDGSAWLPFGSKAIHLIAPRRREWICISRSIGCADMEAMNAQVRSIGRDWVAFGRNPTDTIRRGQWTLQIDACGGYCVDVRSRESGIDRVRVVGGSIKQITAVTGGEARNNTFNRTDDGPCKVRIMGYDGGVCELHLESMRGPGEIIVTYSPER